MMMVVDGARFRVVEQLAVLEELADLADMLDNAADRVFASYLDSVSKQVDIVQKSIRGYLDERKGEVSDGADSN